MSLALVCLSLVGCRDRDEGRAGDERRPAGEREPVAGRESDDQSHGRLLMVDRQGKQWLVTDKQLVKDVEQKLDDAGYDVTVDGDADLQLMRALTQFQQKNGVQASGKIDPRTCEALGLDFMRFEQDKSLHEPEKAREGE
jgi:hypothetical protein